MSDVARRIEAMRERGAHGVDPVRLGFIEAMARRSLAHDGDVRRLLDDRLDELLADHEQPPAVPAVTPNREVSRPEATVHRGLVGQMLDRIADDSPSRSIDAPASHAAHALSYIGDIWSRLNIDRRVKESLSTVPKNAGPLNSHHLVHRSLALMREVSPEYLKHFMAHVDALAWLDDTQAAAQRKPALRR